MREKTGRWPDRLVVVASLEEVYAVFTDQIDDPVLFREPSRPGIRRKAPQSCGSIPNSLSRSLGISPSEVQPRAA